MVATLTSRRGLGDRQTIRMFVDFWQAKEFLECDHLVGSNWAAHRRTPLANPNAIPSGRSDRCASSRFKALYSIQRGVTRRPNTLSVYSRLRAGVR